MKKVVFVFCLQPEGGERQPEDKLGKSWSKLTLFILQPGRQTGV